MKQNDKDPLMFPRIAKLLEPRYWRVAVAEEDVAKDTGKAQIIKEIKHIIEGRDNRGDVVTMTTTPQSAREDSKYPEKKNSKGLVSPLLSMQNQNQSNAHEDVPQQTTHSIKEKIRPEY